MLLTQAQKKLASAKPVSLDVECLPLLSALGRVAAQDVISELAIPPADNSAMDGFAVRANEAGEGIVFLVSQRIAAGDQTQPLKPGTAARIFTGANIPSGADAVVIQENCEFENNASNDQVKILKAVEVGANIRPRGQDIEVGARVITRGQRLNAIDISLLASIGVAEVAVYERLKIAILSTGNELIDPGRELQEGQIYNSNRPLLISLCKELGYEPFDGGIVPDTLEDTKSALTNVADQAHLILTSGGVSVGEEDHVKPAIESIGQLDLWKVQIKPGKPVAFGQIGSASFLGLPGNPVSSFVVFQLLAVPLMQALQGQLQQQPQSYSVVSGFEKAAQKREEYIRVKLLRDEQGNWVAARFANLSSGVMSSLSWADGLVRQDIDQKVEVGAQLQFYPLRQAML